TLCEHELRGLCDVHLLEFRVGSDIDFFFFFSSRRRHTRWPRDWSSDVCSSDLVSQLLRLHGPSNRCIACETAGEHRVQQIAVRRERVPEQISCAARPEFALKDSRSHTSHPEASQDGVREIAMTRPTSGRPSDAWLPGSAWL